MLVAVFSSSDEVEVGVEVSSSSVEVDVGLVVPVELAPLWLGRDFASPTKGNEAEKFSPDESTISKA